MTAYRTVQKQVEAGRLIRGIIESKDMPEAMKHELYSFYDELCETVGQPDVAVATRSSGAVSMPGQMETYLNVRGKKEVVKKVIKVWGSAFTTRAIAFRLEKGMDMTKAPYWGSRSEDGKCQMRRGNAYRPAHNGRFDQGGGRRKLGTWERAWCPARLLPTASWWTRASWIGGHLHHQQ